LLTTGWLCLPNGVAGKIGFDWVRFKLFIVDCLLLVVVAVTGVISIFGISKIGFVWQNSFHLNRFFPSAQKIFVSAAEAAENTRLRLWLRRGKQRNKL
jgi:hypothetical protein